MVRHHVAVMAPPLVRCVLACAQLLSFRQRCTVFHGPSDVEGKWCCHTLMLYPSCHHQAAPMNVHAPRAGCLSAGLAVPVKAFQVMHLYVSSLFQSCCQHCQYHTTYPASLWRMQVENRESVFRVEVWALHCANTLLHQVTACLPLHQLPSSPKHSSGCFARRPGACWRRPAAPLAP